MFSVAENKNSKLLSAIKDIVVGEAGFVAVMDPEGVFIIHPTLQGKSAANFTWAQKEILRKKNGSVAYTDSNGREKIAYYKYYEPWNWYIITGSFVSEIFNTTRELFKGLLLLCLVVILLSAGIAYAMSITFNSSDRRVNRSDETGSQRQSNRQTASHAK